MSPYHYSPLSKGSGSIRLFRLLPSEAEGAEIRGELLEHCLQESSRSSYEALSYVWGCMDTVLSIFIGDEHLDVTPNLYAALLRLRDASFPRIIWIDAICINQADDEEKEYQIQFMANIYGKANRVVVWLGEMMDSSDEALEAIRAAGIKLMRDSGSQKSEQAVASLLEREWFQRIWVLQEVAAARHILIMCGTIDIDGYAFCSGLEQFKDILSSLRTQVRAVTYLIRGAIFRPKFAMTSFGRQSLNICSLAELLSMYHTHQATQRHDKIYALLGMVSDDISDSGLLPDYKVPWNELLQRLIQFLLGKKVLIKTWNDREEAEIYGNGCVLGYISEIENHRDGNQAVDMKFNGALENVERYNNKLGCSWTIQATANKIEKHDIVYLLEGASKPLIIRAHRYWFHIIMMGITPPVNLRSRTFPHNLPLIWDWSKFSAYSQRRVPNMTKGSISPWNGTFILKDMGEDKGAKVAFGKAIQWLSAYEDRLPITERDVSGIVRRFNTSVVDDLLHWLGREIQITEGILSDIAQFHDGIMITQVLDNKRNDQVTGTIVQAAARNIQHAFENVPLLLDWEGHEAVPITEGILIAAAENKKWGSLLMQLLNVRTSAKMKTTEAVLVAAAENVVSGRSIITCLIEYGVDEHQITEAVLVAAAKNEPHGGTMMKTLVQGMKERVKLLDGALSEAVCAAAAGNKMSGAEIIGLMLDYQKRV